MSDIEIKYGNLVLLVSDQEEKEELTGWVCQQRDLLAQALGTQFLRSLSPHDNQAIFDFMLGLVSGDGQAMQPVVAPNPIIFLYNIYRDEWGLGPAAAEALATRLLAPEMVLNMTYDDLTLIGIRADLATLILVGAFRRSKP